MRLIDADALMFTDFEIEMCDGDFKKAFKLLIEKIENAPTVNPTIYGYPIECLGYIAAVMAKKGVSPEEAVQTFKDAGRVIEMFIDETQKIVEDLLGGKGADDE